MTNYFKAGDYIWMLEANHSFDFSVSHRGFPRSELAFEGLQSVDLFSFFVGDLINHAKTAFTKGLEDAESFNQQCTGWMGLRLITCHFILYYLK